MSVRSLLSGPIAKASLASLAVRVAGILLVAVQAILTARLLGPEGYGVVAFVVAVSHIMATVALFGSEPLSVREVARLQVEGDEARLRGFVRRMRVLLVSTSAIGVIAAVFVLPRLAPDTGVFSEFVLFAAVLFPALAFLIQTQGLLNGLGRVMASTAPFQLIRPSILVGVLVVAWLLNADLSIGDYLAAAVAGTLAALIWSVYVLARALPRRRQAAKPPEGSLRRAAPYFAVSLLVLLHSEVSTLMLAWLASAEETGLFQPIARLAPLLMIGVQAATVRYAPRVSELWTRGELDRLASITRTFTWTTTTFTFLAGLVLILLAEEVLGLFGQAFRANASALWWVIGAQVLSAALGPVGVLLTMTDRATAAVWPQAIGLVVNLGAGVLLIPAYGAYGAAVALSLGLVTCNLGLMIAARTGLGFDPSLIASLRRARTDKT
ncbi:MAG: oligosaccharide flippase family protein [Paracoccaceae bacterium]|nr:oligosaccharide flippase family protein [Paracoccaceae bacterium]